MEQLNDSNLRGNYELFWTHSTNEIPHDWEEWAGKFHITIIAKDSLDIDDVNKPPDATP